MSIVGSKTRHGTEPLDGVIFILEDIFWDGHTVLMVPCPTPIAAHHVPSLWKPADAVRFNGHFDARLCSHHAFLRLHGKGDKALF